MFYFILILSLVAFCEAGYIYRGTRRRGRPRKGRREEVERDLHVQGVRRWREMVIDREKWRGIVRQAKDHIRL
jgi:hypothetical protein